jgi:hypothetical protein
MKIPEGKKLYNPVIYGIAFITVAVHLLIINNLEYHRDELLYFSLGQHPAAGYATVPPLIGWIAMIMQKLFGCSLFAVRLVPSILGGTMIIVVASMARELGGSQYASFLAVIGLSVSIFFMRTYSLFMPVFIELFLWTLCIYLIIRYINSEKGKFLVLFGIVAGIAMLNKYLAALLFMGLVLIIPFTAHNKIFLKKHFWIGMAAAFMIFLPNLLWQVSKGFPVFRHMNELYDTQLVHMDVPLFLREQLLMPFAGSILTIAGLIFLLFRKDTLRYRFLGFLSLFIIGALLILKGKSYYTLGVFPLLIASGAAAYDRWLKKSWLRVVVPLLLVVLTIPVIPMGMAVFNKEGLKKYFTGQEEKTGLTVGRRFEDGSIHSLPQDYADMIGWEELTAVAARAYESVSDKKACFIYCENYGQAGAITVIGKKYGLPEAVCFSESFRYWFPRSFSPDIKSFIYINSKLGDDVKSFFRKITVVGSITDPDAREYGTTVWLCEDPAGSFNEVWALRTSVFKDRK